MARVDRLGPGILDLALQHVALEVFNVGGWLTHGILLSRLRWTILLLLSIG